MTAEHPLQLVRGNVFHFLRDPAIEATSSAWEYFEDGALLIEDGRILRAGEWHDISAFLQTRQRQATETFDYRGKLITPGLIDCHTHYAQLGIIGAPADNLLDWLTRHTFPAEARFADPHVAEESAAFFLDRLLAHGTTTASIFATVHPHSVDALFAAAQARNMRVLCGKVMMDRNCPDNLRDTPESALRDSRTLIERWHGKGRLRYSVTPRFAPSSSEAQLRVASELFRAYPDMHLQSHLAENLDESAWVAKLFPDCRDYLDVYDRMGLLGPRAIYGHGIHLSDAAFQRLAETGTALAHCPSSNLFLGSGLFPYARAHQAGTRIGLGSDVGAGTSLSMLRTMAAAYTVSQFVRRSLTGIQMWYLATLGGATALSLDALSGNFAKTKEADFTVWRWDGTPEGSWRMRHAESLGERLFSLATLGDERSLFATHISGRRQYHATREFAFRES